MGTAGRRANTLFTSISAPSPTRLPRSTSHSPPGPRQGCRTSSGPRSALTATILPSTTESILSGVGLHVQNSTPSTSTELSLSTGSYWRSFAQQVLCFDPDDKSGVPLASYELDGTPTEHHTSVIMCKIYRPSSGASWKVEAVGKLGLGKAGHYEPIQSKIAQIS